MTYAVILAGGKGERFWPRSRATRPKQLLTLVGKRNLLEATRERIRPLAGRKQCLVVTGKDLAGPILKATKGLTRSQVLAEPWGMNTAPAVGLAASYLSTKDPKAVMIVLPADHHIPEVEKFIETLKVALTLAERDLLVTIGITPQRPETGYGYIQLGEGIFKRNGITAHKVQSFKEKPDYETAQRFLAAGNYLWNGGIFVWKAQTILDAIGEFLPGLGSGLAQIQGHWGKSSQAQAIARAYRKAEKISIDYGVMEKAHPVACVKGEFAWDDVGSWHAMERLALSDIQGNIIQGDVVTLDTRNATLISDQGLVATLGIRDLIVVRTQDATLVANKQDAQRVREIVQALGLSKRYKKYV
jgi:mannose-1-phosphate guanylyltransferase